MEQEDWNKLVYPQQKSICFVMSSVFLYYSISLLLLVVFWKYAQKRVLVVSTLILVLGFSAFAMLQVICYIDFLVEIGRCQVYSRLITSMGNLEHFIFDLYQIQKILPLTGTVFKNPKPIAIVSWILLFIRLGCFIAETVLQNPAIAPPLGGFRTPGYGICFNSVNRVDRELLVGIKVGSYAFEFLLFAQLVLIIYRLRRGPTGNMQNRKKPNTSINRLLDFELILFGIYFLLDAFFLVMFLVPNAGFVYAVSAIVYNAVLPTIIVGNILAIRWARLRYEAPVDVPPNRTEEQGTTPTQRDSQSYPLTSVNQSRYVSSLLSNKPDVRIINK